MLLGRVIYRGLEQKMAKQDRVGKLVRNVFVSRGHSEGVIWGRWDAASCSLLRK